MVMAEEPVTMTASPKDANNLTLYYHRYSFYSQKVLLALYEKRLAFKGHEIDITRGEQYGPWFLEINPRGEVPVLQDGDKVVPDSAHIIDYLEDHYHGENVQSLVPIDPVSKHKIIELRKLLDQLPGNVLTIGSFHHKEFVDKPKLPFIFPVRWLLSRAEENSAATLRQNAEKIPAARDVLLRKATAQERTHEIVEDGKKFSDALTKVETALSKVEEALGSGPWLGGNQFTVADVSLAVLLERLAGLGLDTKLWGGRSVIKGYYERLQQRDAFKAAVPRGWLPLVALTQWQAPAAITATVSAIFAGFLLFKKKH